MAAAAAPVGTGPRYAPHDPTLPAPWRALVDGNTGYLYYWNPESNVTQYEKPVAQAPPVPPGPPPVASTPKLAPIPTGHSVHGQQQGGGAVLHGGEDNRGVRLGNDPHSDANKAAMAMTVQPKLAAIPIMRNQQPQQHHQQPQQHHQQQHVMQGTNSSHVAPGFANGSSVPAGLGPRQAADPYKYVPNGTNFANPNVKPTPRVQGNAELPNSTAVDAYRRQHEVSAQGENVPAPFMTFEQTGFPPELLRELQNAGFASPTPIQAQSWPIAMQNQDIVAIAKTGSGKTLGYLLPAFIHLRRRCNNTQMGPTVLVLAPTRELATQIQDEAIKFGRSSRITCTCLYGGAPKGPQLRDLERGVDIVVATPGRLNDILETKKVNLQQISFLALDEADRMLDMGFEPQIRKIVNEIPRQRQTLMYTATWPKEVRKIAGDLLINPVQVTIGTIDELAANNSITQYVEVVAPMEKQRRVEQILRGQEPGSRIIIFCSTKRMCDQLARSLGRQFGAIAIHGDKSQGERDWVLGQFRTGKSPVLVATDVAARGLDIKDIRVVINYDFPTGVEDYVHRIGRTGRAGATGLAHTFLSDQDAKYAPDLIKVLERANQRVPPEVRDMASRAGSFNKGRGGRWDFGGRGGRDAGRGFGGGRVDSFGGRGGWGGPVGRSDRSERGFGGFGGGRGRYERDTRDRYDGGRGSFDIDGRERHDRGRPDRYMDDRDRARDDFRKVDDWDGRGRSKTKSPKKSKEAVLKGWLQKSAVRAEKVHYTATFSISSDFGQPGAIIVTNQHQKEFYLETIVLEEFIGGPVYFPCNSWVHSNKVNPEERIFFSNKPYLPSQTPEGLKQLRQKELQDLRGDGKGTRKHSDRIYDYDVYNDLGNPDKSNDLARPLLGGEDIPYPRRCRTGRPPTATDPSAESRVEEPTPLYVPRDETFEEIKQDTFAAGRLKAILHNLIPSLIASLTDPNKEFQCFSEIDRLYKEGFKLQFELQNELLKNMPKVVNQIRQTSEGLLRYDTPSIISKDRFAWLRDDEFARQTLAGVNPVSIELLKVFPPVSKLDPKMYGSPESAIKEEHILGQLNGMSVEQALEANKLFILDYHDAYFPVIEEINALDGRKAYATRTIFFLSPLNTLKPIAIELSLPPPSPGCQSKQVFTPANDATTYWRWQLAKAHVCANDAGIHQVVNHWLRTHAAMEPYVISAHRNLSAMHPILKLLQPHMRYTMEINALARQILINAEGVIESSFTPSKYCMDLSATAYRTQWRFDLEALPADLVRRGMAVEDPTQPHGIKLVIEDYPYAADGLLIWSSIKEWVEEYVGCYYSDTVTVQNDVELQAWWYEIKNTGHADKKNETWWPKLETKEDLTGILTTMIWIASGQHAALNFGQYPYGGYVPNRPCLMRRLIPEEEDPEYQNFLSNPQKYFLSSLPSLLQALNTMAVIDTLSTHSPDEEYLGQRQHSIWTSDLNVIDAFHKFSASMQRIEKTIHQRNKDLNLRNRNGAGVVPYELLIPTSEPGVTGRGVPNSVSI